MVDRPTLEAEIQPEKLENVAQTVAAGLATPAPGLHGGGHQQGVGVAAPVTPALPTPSAKRQRAAGEEVEREVKRQDATESPRKAAGKREAEPEVEEETEKRKQMK